VMPWARLTARLRPHNKTAAGPPRPWKCVAVVGQRPAAKANSKTRLPHSSPGRGVPPPIAGRCPHRRPLQDHPPPTRSPPARPRRDPRRDAGTLELTRTLRPGPPASSQLANWSATCPPASSNRATFPKAAATGGLRRKAFPRRPKPPRSAFPPAPRQPPTHRRREKIQAGPATSADAHRRTPAAG